MENGTFECYLIISVFLRLTERSMTEHYIQKFGVGKILMF